MSDEILLLVSERSGVFAVMKKYAHDYVYEPGISFPEQLRRRNRANILSFAPRELVFMWGPTDPRTRGIAGTDEDLHGILQQCIFNEANFPYVPFSHDKRIAEMELPVFGATWEKFHEMFYPDAWSFKFNKKSDWLV